MARWARYATGALAAGGVWLGLVSSASASGGPSIAGAPAIAYGTPQFGNTVTDDPMNFCNQGGSDPTSWWLAAGLLAGDRLDITFGGFDALNLLVFGVGTTDANLSDAPDVAEKETMGTANAHLSYTATQDGTLPLQFQSLGGCDAAGGFSFTASVTHQIVIYPRIGSRPARHETRFAVALYHPDGSRLTDPSLRATYSLVSHGHVSRLAVRAAPFSYTRVWPRSARGRRETVRVTITGAGYRTVVRNLSVTAH